MNQKNELKQKILSETAKIDWSALETFYAKGSVIWVSSNVDLIDIAMKFAEDDTASIQNLLVSGEIEKMTPEKARKWQQQSGLWATVVAPWVLVQHRPKIN
ncbi:MAG TPA: DUF2288 domain-containing protein [Aeromonadales bacterium]|nr:DUF2288 domain-containing protein [Aeromonadales bacterium]